MVQNLSPKTEKLKILNSHFLGIKTILEQLHKPLAYLKYEGEIYKNTPNNNVDLVRNMKLIYINSSFLEYLPPFPTFYHSDDESDSSESGDEYKLSDLPESILTNPNFIDAYKKLLFTTQTTETIVCMDFPIAKKHFKYSFVTIKNGPDDFYIGILGSDITSEINEKLLNEKINQTRNEFMGHVSHEIRTPLNGINAAIEIMNNSNKIPDELKKYMVILDNCSIALLTIINDLLDLSRMEAKKLTLIHKPFSLITCINSAAMLVDSQAHEKKLKVDIDIDNTIPQNLIGDVGRIRQIITNFLMNAIKFTPSGFVKLSVQKINEEPISLTTYNKIAKSYENYLSSFNKNTKLITLQIKITDSGIGIPEEKISTLFSPFIQIDSSLRKKHNGMGLGLSICKNLIELMNGSIDVKSTENLGSSFIFTIRLPEYTTITSIDESHYKTLIGKTAIIIDDNKTNLKFIEQTLIKCKMPLTTCDSSIDSLEYFKNTVPFDFIILDICLPNMDGCELSNKIRNEYKYTCPIIGISSINQDQLDKNIYNHYFDVILTKPIQSIELISTILMLLSEKPKLPQTVPPTRRPTKKNTRTILSDSECTLNNSQKKHTAYLTPRNSIDCSDDELPQHLTQRSISSHNVYNPLYQQSSSHTNIIDLEILLVEDNEINAQITFDQFNSFGVNKIDHAINGTCGFDMAKNKLYDVIFMDISMPGMDGIECSEKILEFYKNKNTKTPYIIALTANTMTETLAAAKNSGMKKILLKPVKIDDFKNTLISFLRKFP